LIRCCGCNCRNRDWQQAAKRLEASVKTDWLAQSTTEKEAWWTANSHLDICAKATAITLTFTEKTSVVDEERLRFKGRWFSEEDLETEFPGDKKLHVRQIIMKSGGVWNDRRGVWEYEDLERRSDYNHLVTKAQSWERQAVQGPAANAKPAPKPKAKPISDGCSSGVGKKKVLTSHFEKVLNQQHELLSKTIQECQAESDTMAKSAEHAEIPVRIRDRFELAMAHAKTILLDIAMTLESKMVSQSVKELRESVSSEREKTVAAHDMCKQVWNNLRAAVAQDD